MSGASERANGRAGGPVLTSAFLIILAHSGGGNEDGVWMARAKVVIFAVMVDGGEIQHVGRDRNAGGGKGNRILGPGKERW